MNFLAHALLSGEVEADRVGGVMGDFVKGPLPAGLPPDLARFLSQGRLREQANVDFSPYVPQQVRDYITGVFKSLPSLSADLSGDLLRRLMSNDPRMRTVWADLSRIAQSDEDYVKFVQAAWLARKDYATWRKRLRQAGELGRQIAGKANELAELLGQIQQTHTRLPSEFSSIQLYKVISIRKW